MAVFEIEQAEGTRWAKITLDDETIVTERGALSHFRGNIRMKGRIPGPIRLIRAALSGEDSFRPTFSGTGSLFLESSLGGFHLMDLAENEKWVVESGAFWASEARVHQSFTRERILTAFRTGEGFLDFKTKVEGPGKVMLCAPGSVEEVILSKDSPNKGRIVVDGKQVLARTTSVSHRVEFPGWMPWTKITTGERILRVYEGEGRLLMCTTPYWRFKVMQERKQAPGTPDPAAG